MSNARNKIIPLTAHQTLIAAHGWLNGQDKVQIAESLNRFAWGVSVTPAQIHNNMVEIRGKAREQVEVA